MKESMLILRKSRNKFPVTDNFEIDALLFLTDRFE